MCCSLSVCVECDLTPIAGNRLFSLLVGALRNWIVSAGRKARKERVSSARSMENTMRFALKLCGRGLRE